MAYEKSVCRKWKRNGTAVVVEKGKKKKPVKCFSCNF